jgi:predicted Holliday junction resolvase-like endonuclease
MKAILLIILLFFACGIAMVMIQRLLAISTRVGELRGELARKNDSLQEQMARMQQQQARLDAERILAEEKNSSQIIEGEVVENNSVDKSKEI